MFKDWTLNRVIGITLAVVSVLLPYSLMQGVVFLLILLLFIDNFRAGNFSVIHGRRVSISIISLALFVGFEIVSLSYSEDLRFGMSQFEKKIPILLSVLLFIFFKERKRFSLQMGLEYYSIGVIVLLFISSGFILYDLFYGTLSGKVLYSGITNINFLSGIGHRTYVGFIVLMAFPIWFQKIINSESGSDKLTYVSILILASLILFLTGARAILISMIFVWGYLIFNLIRAQIKNTKILVTFGVVIISIGALILFNSPRFHLILESLFEGDFMNSSEPRIYTWRAAWMAISDQYLWGYGIGDGKLALQDALRELQYGLGYANEFNAHNQYLETWLAAGILPVIAMITFFISLLFIRGKRHLFAVTFAIVAGINFAFESMLVRNIGVFPFVYWILMIFMTKQDDDDSEHHVISARIYRFAILFLLTCICGILIYASTLKFNSEDPGSYMQVPYQQNKESLSDNATVNAVGIDCNDLNFLSIKDGDFSVIPFYNSTDDRDVSVSASVWAYVPEESTIGRFWFFIYDKRDKSETIDYDLSKSGTWQRLSIDSVSLSKSFEIGLRIDYFESNFVDWNTDRGKVKFAQPYFKIQ